MTSLPPTFELERYFAKYESTTRHLLCCSDAEPMQMSDILQMADDQCKELWTSLKLSYTEAKGSSLLRHEISLLHDVSVDDVLVVAPQEGIYIAMRCLVNYFKYKDESAKIHAIATFPAYQSLYENLKVEGCMMSYWNVKESDNGWQFSIEELENMITSKTKLLVVNFPHNPTGFVPSQSQWLQIVDVCRKNKIFIFSDEMYRLSNNDDSPPLPSASACYENSVTLFGLSKTFALPGLRIGWLVTKNKKVFDMMCNFKDYITICPPAPCEILSLIALRNHHDIQQHTIEILKMNLEILDMFFKEHSDLFVWYKPKACTTGLVRIKGWLLNIGSGGAAAFCEELLKQKQVLLLPSVMYGISDEFFRISFGRKDMQVCIEKLKEFIKESQHQYK